MADEKLEAAAAQAMREGGDIRARVRDLTLAALRDHRFDLAAMQSVMRDVGAGIKLGAETHGGEMKDALTAAFGGLDEASGSPRRTRSSPSKKWQRAAVGWWAATGSLPSTRSAVWSASSLPRCPHSQKKPAA